MNLPNKLTVLRVLLVPVFMILMEIGLVFNEATYTYSTTAYMWALVVFCVASFTDFLDGSIARKYNMVTDFGKFMDPLADKVLTTVALIYLMQFDVVNPIILSIVLVREFAVSGIRMIAASSGGGKVIAASIWGKAKTVLQMVAIMLTLATVAFSTNVVFIGENFVEILKCLNVVMWLMAVATVISGLQYIIPNYDLIKNAK